MPRRALGDVRADGARARVQRRLSDQRGDEAVRPSAELRLAYAVPGWARRWARAACAVAAQRACVCVERPAANAATASRGADAAVGADGRAVVASAAAADAAGIGDRR